MWPTRLLAAAAILPSLLHTPLPGQTPGSGLRGDPTVLGFVLAAAAGPLVAARPVRGGPPPDTAAPCDGPAYHRLDFWLGEWEVTAGGQAAGTNRIIPILGGCAIEEHWVSSDGQPGQSFFYYLPALDQWRQVWVTGNPAAPGGVKEKHEVPGVTDLRFQGEIALTDGRRYLDRTTLSRLPEGRVRQLIEISTDGGATWRPTFDAVYTRKAIPPR